MIFALAVISFLVWIYLAVAHGSFWRVSRFMAPDEHAEARQLLVAAIVPARDEADVIGAAMASLLEQRGARVRVFLIDDASSDGTAAVALEAARAAGKDGQLTVIQGKPLPEGWSGKLWAVQQGVEAASKLNADYLLLTDADIAHSPENLAGLIATAQKGNYDLISLMVRLHCETFAERALIPAFVFFFLMLYPPSWVANPRRKTAGAAGGCILIGPQALERAGGISAIRHEIIDDCALARRVKDSGGRIWLALTAETRSIRPYGSFANIGRMISRAAFNQLHHSTLLLVGTLVGLMITYVAPPLLALFSHRLVPTLLGAASWLLMSLCFLPAIRLYRLNPLWSVALPAIAVFYMGATLDSAFKFWMGKGGEWKGRVQDPVHKTRDQISS